MVLVTDGQVGNEDQILHESADALRRIRVHTVGVDQAVNAGFLGRLASAGGGRCELVESEDRLDAAMECIHRRIGAPLVTRLSLSGSGLTLDTDAQTPSRLPDLFSGVPYVVRGRYTGAAAGSLTLSGRRPSGETWSVTAPAQRREVPTLGQIWARSVLRDREDEYASREIYADQSTQEDLERRIVATSLRFGVLCRFTAYVAVDPSTVTDGRPKLAVIQPVDSPAGWDMFGAQGAVAMAAPMEGAVIMAAPMSMRPPMPKPAAVSRSAQLGGVPPTASGGRPGRPPAAPGLLAPSAQPAPGPALGDARSAPAQSGSDELRRRAADEARRLRDGAAEPWYRRRDLLEDLGSRLAVLAAPGGAGTGALAELAKLLRADTLETVASDAAALEDLWARVLRVLDDFAAGSRGSFWKR